MSRSIYDLSSNLVEHNWHLVAHSSEIKNHNDFLLFEIGDEEIVLFNDMSEIIAFNNSCPHRGTRVFTARLGNKKYICPYHGWCYINKEVKPSSPSLFRDIDFSKVSLPLWKVEKCGEFIFVGRSPEKTIYDQLGTIFNKLEKISRSIHQSCDFNHFTYQSPWYISIENALEAYHLPYVHPSTLNTLSLKNIHHQFDGKNSILSGEIGKDSVVRGLNNLRKYFHIDYEVEGYESIYIFPFAFISTTRGYSYSLQNFFPNSNLNITNFNSRFYKSKLKDPQSNLLDALFQSSIDMNRRIFDEDHEICKLYSSRNWLKNITEGKSLLSEMEIAVKHFRECCLTKLSQSYPMTDNESLLK